MVWGFAFEIDWFILFSKRVRAQWTLVALSLSLDLLVSHFLFASRSHPIFPHQLFGLLDSLWLFTICCSALRRNVEPALHIPHDAYHLFLHALYSPLLYLYLS